MPRCVDARRGFPRRDVRSLGPAGAQGAARGGNATAGTQGAVYRREALAHAQTAYLVAMVWVQWADLLVCVTRVDSLFVHGLQYVAVQHRGPPPFPQPWTASLAG